MAPKPVLPSGLPIDAVVPEVRRALGERGAAVVHAPPGAGKTTILPLALVDEAWMGTSRIVMLEPRRLAARAAAHRMAHLIGETAGRTVGYRTRLDTRVSAATRIEVVTEGVLTRIIQDDPTLAAYSLVAFDEFHERSLNADLGLALVLYTRRLVRPDLRLLVMSATLDGTAVARLLDGAPIIQSAGRRFEVETRYLPPGSLGRQASIRPARIAAAVASGVRTALAEGAGDCLAFLPGAPEIHRTARELEPILPPNVDVIPLHGMLKPEDQDRAIAPSPPGRRKVVLATSIAETSLTIDGVRLVVDSGLARRSRFSPRTGMSRLETQRVSRASADQRRGRAARTAPGICYRLWDSSEDAGLIPFAPPEIMDGDLTPLALDLAVAGIADPLDLDWLDAPPVAALGHARELLLQLEAVDERGVVSAHGREMASLGMHPRLAHMVLRGATEGNGALACDIAALLDERDPLRGQAVDVGVDLRARLGVLRDPTRALQVDRAALRRIAEQSRRWRSQRGIPDQPRDEEATGRVLALAFPDRVAQRRPGHAARYLLRSGSGVTLPEGDPLSREPWIVVAESDGRVPEGRAYLAASLEEADVNAEFRHQVAEREVVAWDDEAGIKALLERRLGAILLSAKPIRAPAPDRVAAAVADAIRRQGLGILPWTSSAEYLRRRLAFLHQRDRTWPDMSDQALTDSILHELRNELGRIRSAAALRRIDMTGALWALIPQRRRAAVDRLAPTHFVAPTGSRVPIDYADPDAPKVAIRLQEMFGCRTTPAVFDGRVPVTLHLLSPAHRPVQVTQDLAGFWRSSYLDVRKELRSRYPKHSWPEDPLAALPTTRTRQ